MSTRKRKASTNKGKSAKEPAEKKAKTTGKEKKAVRAGPEDVSRAHKDWAETSLNEIHIFVPHRENPDDKPTYGYMSNSTIQTNSAGLTTLTFDGHIMLTPGSNARFHLENRSGEVNIVIDTAADKTHGAPELSEFKKENNWTVIRFLSSRETDVVFELHFVRDKLSSGKIVLNKVQLTLPADLVYKGKAAPARGAFEFNAAGEEKKNDDGDWAIFVIIHEDGDHSSYFVPDNDDVKKMAGIFNKMHTSKGTSDEEDDWRAGMISEWDRKYTMPSEVRNVWAGKRVSAFYSVAGWA